MEGEGRVLWMKYGSLLPLLVLVLALWFRSPQDAVLDDRVDAVLSSLLRAERKVGINTVVRPRVAIGKSEPSFNNRPNALKTPFLPSRYITLHMNDVRSCCWPKLGF